MSKAAVELGLTTGAVSQQIRQLEEGLEVSLLGRDNRRIWLTAEGEALTTTLVEAFGQIDGAIARISAGSAMKKIRFHLMPAFAALWLLPRVIALYDRYPDIEIELSTARELELVNLDNTDFAVRLGTGEWNDALADFLFYDELVVVCSPDVARSLHQATDVFRHPLLHSIARTNAWSEWFSAQGLPGLEIPSGVKLAHSALTFQAAAKGLGIAVGQLEYVRGDLEAGRLVIPNIGRSYRSGAAYYLVHSKRKTGQRNIRLLRKWLNESALR